MGLWLFLGCSSLRVNVDYDPKFDFSSQRDFVVLHKNREGEDTLYNDRVIRALVSELEAKAYRKTEREEADLVFVFHTNVESKTDIDSDYRMIGYGGYGYSRMMVSSTRTYHYKKGTLIIDALEPSSQKIVWRGVATDVLKKQETPQERTAYINEVVKETMKDFPRRQAPQ